ncbi:MAG: hypothetical protein K8963_03465 [Proteobacteria bacterium]|nr:hypothetical protein [Pseudomonadota bacterium]
MIRVAQSGVRAGRAGKRLERNVREILTDNGYRKVSPNEFLLATGDADQGLKIPHEDASASNPIFAEQVHIGESIYGQKRKVDFVLYHPKQQRERLVIQCKWQSVGGSTHEKYPYEVECINMSGVDTIIVLDGDGYSKGAHSWLTQQTRKIISSGYLIAVKRLGEFEKLTKSGKIMKNMPFKHDRIRQAKLPSDSCQTAHGSRPDPFRRRTVSCPVA